MNVLMLSEVSAERVIGGAERVLREQARGLRFRGHTVSIVARAQVPEADRHITVDGIDEYRYPIRRGNELSMVASSLRGSLRSFDHAASHRRPDAILIHQSLAGLAPLLARRGVRRLIYVCLSLAHEEYRSRNRPSTSITTRLRYAMNATARLWIERLAISRCARVVVLSEFMSRRVQQFHRIAPDKIRIIPGAVDHERFRPPAGEPARMAIRRSLGLPEHRTILFTVRNLVPRMGLDNLLTAMPMVRQAGHEPLLLIGGEGPLKADLVGTVNRLGLTPHVELLGFVPETSLPDYYRAADLVVLPTHELEGFGLVTVEGLACGSPVLGTPIGAIPEVLRRVDPTLVAAGCDAASLADSISRLLGRFHRYPGERERLSFAGRQLVEKEYTWGRHSEELEGVLQETIGCAR